MSRAFVIAVIVLGLSLVGQAQEHNCGAGLGGHYDCLTGPPRTGQVPQSILLSITYKRFQSNEVRAALRSKSGAVLVDVVDTPYFPAEIVYVRADRLAAAMKVYKRSHKVFVLRITE